jgi:hypothetical protein
MKKLPDKKELDIMWTVATSSAIESGTRPHIIFARMLYNDIMDIKPPVGLCDEKGNRQT